MTASNFWTLCCALALTACVAPRDGETAPESVAGSPPGNGPPAWIELYDGASLDGWVGGTTSDPEAFEALSPEAQQELQSKWSAGLAEHWFADGAELVSDGAGPHLVTAESYGDFEFEFDWKIQPNGDSGVYLRGYPQVQIWDPENAREAGNGADKGSGGLWNNRSHERFPAVRADHPAGEWNHMLIHMEGPRVHVWLNGVAIVAGVELDNYFRPGAPILERGPIHLQTHGSEVRFRGIRVRPLAAGTE